MAQYDFGIFWRAGRAVCMGQDPYAVAGFFYPLPAAYLFAVLAAVPQPVAYWAWLAFNLGLLVIKLRNRLAGWALYFPLLHFFSSGQVSVLLWVLATSLTSGPLSAAAAAVITLKPQVAFIVLPWTLWHWFRGDKKTLVTWLGLTVALWSVPLLVDPTWPIRWTAAAPHLDLATRGNTPGLWSLEPIVPRLTPFIVVVSAVLFAWGTLQERPIAWATAALANPAGLFYTLTNLMDTAPAWLIVPASWIAVGLSLAFHSFAPWMLLPMLVIAYHRRDTLRSFLGRR